MAEDPDITAGEYVLGTLDTAERIAFARRLLIDPQAVADVADWQLRLSPLLLSAPDMAVPAGLWTRIDRATRPAAANDNRRLARWRIATAAAGMVALVSAGIALRQRPTPAPAPIVAQTPAQGIVQAVAALSSEGGSPALLVTYDAAGRIRVTPVNVSRKADRSLELWLIAGKAAPKSMGVLPETGDAALDHLHMDPKLDTTIAVSIEPVGGSPTGAPTGPVVYSGRMVVLSKS